MRQPTAPFLELAFFCDRGDEADAFAALVKELERLGAQLLGGGKGAFAPNARKHLPFGWTIDEPIEYLELPPADLRAALADSDARVVSVEMLNATGLYDDVIERVTYLGISPKALSEGDHHPFAIFTEGEAFGVSFPAENPSLARVLTEQANRRFDALVEALEPAYASIAFEDALPCPTDLRSGEDDHAFHDFFVRAGVLSGHQIDVLRNEFGESSVALVDDGIFVRASEPSNLGETELPNPTETGIMVSRMLGEALIDGDKAD